MNLTQYLTKTLAMYGLVSCISSCSPRAEDLVQPLASNVAAQRDMHSKDEPKQNYQSNLVIDQVTNPVVKKALVLFDEVKTKACTDNLCFSLEGKVVDSNTIELKLKGENNGTRDYTQEIVVQYLFCGAEERTNSPGEFYGACFGMKKRKIAPPIKPGQFEQQITVRAKDIMRPGYIPEMQWKLIHADIYTNPNLTEPIVSAGFIIQPKK